MYEDSFIYLFTHCIFYFYFRYLMPNKGMNSLENCGLIDADQAIN